MRDMNQELLNNPFDTDLQAVTRPFGGCSGQLSNQLIGMD